MHTNISECNNNLRKIKKENGSDLAFCKTPLPEN